MRETGSVSNPPRGDGSITIEGTKAELDALRSMLAGVSWMINGEAGITTHPRLLPLPDPTEDPMIPPKWALRVPGLNEASPQEIETAIAQSEYGVKPPKKLADFLEPEEGWHSPSFYVAHLVGYGWTREKYIEQAKLFYSWGFECMRSRRGVDGHYWETWFLPGAWAARGDLKDAIARLEAAKVDWLGMSRGVVSWLCRHAAFGTLDVTVQRAAMTID